MTERRTVHRVCPFCEATCGLSVEVDGNSILSVRGDKDDPFSLDMTPRDADRLGTANGSAARIISRVGSIVAPVEITDDLMPGVVSLPHGWGHDVEASRINHAKQHPGANANALTDDRKYDEVSGTAVLFGTPVVVEAVQIGGK